MKSLAQITLPLPKAAAATLASAAMDLTSCMGGNEHDWRRNPDPIRRLISLFGNLSSLCSARMLSWMVVVRGITCPEEEGEDAVAAV